MKKPLYPWLILAALGCSEPRATPPLPPDTETGLDDAPIPEDFTFQATRPMGFELIAARSDGEVATLVERRLGLQLRHATRGEIYRGSIIEGHTFRFDYPLSADITELEVITTDDSGFTQTRTVQIAPDQAELSVIVGGSQ